MNTRRRRLVEGFLRERASGKGVPSAFYGRLRKRLRRKLDASEANSIVSWVRRALKSVG